MLWCNAIMLRYNLPPTLELVCVEQPVSRLNLNSQVAAVAFSRSAWRTWSFGLQCHQSNCHSAQLGGACRDQRQHYGLRGHLHAHR